MAQEQGGEEADEGQADAPSSACTFICLFTTLLLAHRHEAWWQGLDCLQLPGLLHHLKECMPLRFITDMMAGIPEGQVQQVLELCNYTINYTAQ